MPLTIDDLADHLSTEHATPSTIKARELQRALDTAVQEITRKTGMLDAVTVTAQVAMDAGDSTLQLPYVRLAAVGTVTDPAGIVATPYGVDLLAGIVWVWPVGWYLILLGAWSVQCTGKPWPAALTTAALDWAGHLYDTQRARTQAVDENEPPPSYALPNRVEELIHDYRLPGVA